MKLYILSKEAALPPTINIIEVAVLEHDPYVRVMENSDFDLINSIFGEFSLPELINYQHMRHTLSYEQLLALIISACLPIEDKQLSSYIDLSLPIPKNQTWWPLSNSTNNSKKLWMHLNCMLVADYLAKALTLAKRISLQNNFLSIQYIQFVRNCGVILKLIKPYHPLLPTPEIYHDHDALPYPAHLPQLFHITGINCLNWNIRYSALPSRDFQLADGSPNNSSKKMGRHVNEQTVADQIAMRRRHIRNSLCLLIHKQRVVIGTLQNNFLEDKDFTDLCTQLGDKWQVQFSRDTPNVIILFYTQLHAGRI